MATIPLLLVFFGGLLLFFLTGRLIGHIIGLDKYFSNDKSTVSPGSYKNDRKKKRKVKTKKDSSVNGSKTSAENMTYPGQEQPESNHIK